jgi:hypothetical protein
MQTKKLNSQKAKVSKKRSIDNSKINRSKKRARIVRSHLNNQLSIIKLTQSLNSTIIKHSNNINNDSITATDILQLQNTKK